MTFCVSFYKDKTRVNLKFLKRRCDVIIMFYYEYIFARTICYPECQANT